MDWLSPNQVFDMELNSVALETGIQEKIKDPRLDHKKKYNFSDMFFMTLNAVISGPDNWVIAMFYRVVAFSIKAVL